MNNKFYPMNQAEVLDLVLDVYKRCFLKQISVSIIFSVILYVAFMVMVFAGIIASMFVLFDTMAHSTLSSNGIIIIGVFIMLFLLGLAFYEALISTGSALIAKHTLLNEHFDVGKIVKAAFKKMFVAASAAVANAIMTIPLFVVMAAGMYLYISMIFRLDDMDFASRASITFIIVTGILLILMMVVLIAFFATITMMSMSASIFEGRWLFGAVKRGFSLVRPDFFKLMGLKVLYFVIMFAFSFSVEAFFGMISMLGVYFLPSGASAALSMGTMMIGWIFTLAISVVLIPLSGIFNTIIYINQRIKHEGLDVELNLNALRGRM